jgi:MraZ protein
MRGETSASENFLKILNSCSRKGLQRGPACGRELSGFSCLHPGGQLIDLGRRGDQWGEVVANGGPNPMALTGTYLRTLDEKRRLAVPKRLKDDFGESSLEYLYIAPGTQRSLVIYSPRAFVRLGDGFNGNHTQTNYLRLFYSSAERVDLDGQNRIRIPDRLADYAGLKREAYLLGVQDHAELWDRESWDQFLQTNTPAFDELHQQTFPH